MTHSSRHRAVLQWVVVSTYHITHDARNLAPQEGNKGAQPRNQECRCVDEKQRKHDSLQYCSYDQGAKESIDPSIMISATTNEDLLLVTKRVCEGTCPAARAPATARW